MRDRPLDYLEYIAGQSPGVPTDKECPAVASNEPPDHLRDVPDGKYKVGDVLIDMFVVGETIDESLTRWAAAGDYLTASPKFKDAGPFTFDGRALTNIEMYAASAAARYHDYEGVQLWSVLFTKWMEAE